MLNHSGSKILKTDRLTLRPFRASDAEDMFRNWAGDSEVTKFLTWTPHKNVDETRALLAAWEEEAQRPDVYHWAIECGGKRVCRLLPFAEVLGKRNHVGSLSRRAFLPLRRGKI